MKGCFLGYATFTVLLCLVTGHMLVACLIPVGVAIAWFGGDFS